MSTQTQTAEVQAEVQAEIQAGDSVYWEEIRFTRKMRRLITTQRGRVKAIRGQSALIRTTNGGHVARAVGSLYKLI